MTTHPPDILNDASFASDWNGFTDWASGPPRGVTRDNSQGQYAVKRSWTPSASDTGAQFMFSWPNVDRVWVKWATKLTANVSTIMKLLRYHPRSGHPPLGGLFLGRGNNILQWGWDAENAAIATPIGLTETQLLDGKFHTLEHDYWRNGDPSGFASVGFVFDGEPLFLPDGTKVTFDCTTTTGGVCNRSYWKDGRLYAGERRRSDQLGMFQALSTLNGGNTTNGDIYVTNISISSLGPISGGPMEVSLPLGSYTMVVSATGVVITKA